MLGPLFGLLIPGTIFVVGCGFIVHGSIQVGSEHEALQLFHNGNDLLCRGPFGSGFDHVLADFALVADVGVEYLGPEGDDGSLEGEVVKFELNLELSSFEGRCLWTLQEDDP